MEEHALVDINYVFPEGTAEEEKTAMEELAKKVLSAGTLVYDGKVKMPLQADFES